MRSVRFSSGSALVQGPLQCGVVDICRSLSRHAQKELRRREAMCTGMVSRTALVRHTGLAIPCGDASLFDAAIPGTVESDVFGFATRRLGIGAALRVVVLARVC